MNKQYLLSMTKEEFNSKVLCEGFDAVVAAAKILGVDVEGQDRWEATKTVYDAWLAMQNEEQTTEEQATEAPEVLVEGRYSVVKTNDSRFENIIKVTDHKKNKTYEATKDGLSFRAKTAADMGYVNQAPQLEAEVNKTKKGIRFTYEQLQLLIAKYGKDAKIIDIINDL